MALYMKIIHLFRKFIHFSRRISPADPWLASAPPLKRGEMHGFVYENNLFYMRVSHISEAGNSEAVRGKRKRREEEEEEEEEEVGGPVAGKRAPLKRCEMYDFVFENHTVTWGNHKFLKQVIPADIAGGPVAV